MKKIKIVFILGTLQIGGTETQFLELIKRLDPEQFDLRVLAFSTKGKVRNEIEALHIPFTGLGFSGLKRSPSGVLSCYKLIRTMVNYLRAEQPDIVQSYLFWANIYGSISAKIAGVPIIITGRRGLRDPHHQQWYHQILQYLANLWTTDIVANSQAVKRECLQYERGVMERKIRVIYNGVDHARYFPPSSNASLRDEFKIPDGCQVVGCIANLRPCKGHQVLLEAALLVLQHHPQTRFLLVGDDHGIKSELTQQAHGSGIRGAIVFTGYREDIPDILAICDMLVSTSFSEGFSNVILEAMAAGVPVIGTHVGGTIEMIEHEETGLLVPPADPKRLADAMLRLIDDTPLREKFAQAGIQYVNTSFRIETMVQQTTSLYLELAG